MEYNVKVGQNSYLWYDLPFKNFISGESHAKENTTSRFSPGGTTTRAARAAAHEAPCFVGSEGLQFQFSASKPPFCTDSGFVHWLELCKTSTCYFSRHMHSPHPQKHGVTKYQAREAPEKPDCLVVTHWNTWAINCMWWKQNNLHKPKVSIILKQIVSHGKLTSFSSIQMSLALGSLSLPPSEKHGKLDNVMPGACFAAIANVRGRPPLAAVLDPGTWCAYQFHVYICVYIWVWFLWQTKGQKKVKNRTMYLSTSLWQDRYLIIQLLVHKII